MGKWSGIQCKMCIFLRIGGLWPHMGPYVPGPGGGGGLGADRGEPHRGAEG